VPAKENTASSTYSCPQSTQATSTIPRHTISILTARSIDKHESSITMSSCDMCGRQIVRDERHNGADITFFGRTLCQMCMLYRWDRWCEGFHASNDSSENVADGDEGYHSTSKDEMSDDE